MFFEQEHVPGREAAIDFTDCSSLRVSIAGQFFAHLLFQLILSFSKRRSVSLAFGETLEALVAGLQRALWELGGVPSIARSDNLSAATHALPEGGRELNRRFKAVLDHYGMRSTRIEPGKANQSGVAEKAHDRLKTALQQELILRGSRDFASVESYLAFVEAVRDKLNAPCVSRLAEERKHLAPLPACRLPEYSKYEVVVRQCVTAQRS